MRLTARAPLDCMWGFNASNARSFSVAQLGAREILLRSLSPEYADGTLIFNTKNTRGCVELFVTLGFAHEKPTHPPWRAKRTLANGDEPVESESIANVSPYYASQKHEPASTGPQAIAPWCGRAPRVARGKPRGSATVYSFGHDVPYSLQFLNTSCSSAYSPVEAANTKGQRDLRDKGT